jgi:hypothetical protein
MPVNEGWGLRGMQARCRELREDLVTLAAPVTEQELTDYWPGGAENKLQGVGAWIYCYMRYGAYLDRLRDVQTSAADEEAAELAALKAFRDAPAVVELVRPLPPSGAHPEGLAYLAVHPKSLDTLTLLDELEEEIRWLQERILWLQGRWEEQAPAQTGKALRLLSELDLIACWIATTDGAGVPFAPGSPWPEPPAWLRLLEPLDILNLMRAHHQVNKERIALIATSLRRRGDEDRRASWATLAVRAAGSLRQPMDHLLKVRPLAAWFAEVALKWEDEADRYERSQEAAKRGTKGPPFAEAIG